MTRSEEIMAMADKYLARNYKPLPFVNVVRSGSWVWDAEGTKRLDMLSNYSADNFGALHPRIVDAAIRQLGFLAIDPRCFYNDKLPKLAEMLAQFCGMDRILPKVTGTEAVESAILISRKWGYMVKGLKKETAEIIGCNENFHGRTMGSRSLSTTLEYRGLFGPLAVGFRWIPFGDPDALGRIITKNTVAFFVEPIQGEGGIVVPPDGYLREVEKICRRNNVLLVLDEVQTGFGRTGYDFAYQYENIRHENVRPDLLIVGKALGGGIVPISAVVGPEAVMSVISPGDDGSTFGGNPLACAVAIEAISVLKEERLAERARDMGGYFIACLKKIKSPLIKEVRGRGLMIGVELVEEAGGARKYCEELGKNGVLCYYTRENVLRFSPPLTISKLELKWGLSRIKDVLRGGMR